jgi:hypothetical protein
MALENIGWKYYVVFVIVVILFGFTAYFFYPETRQVEIISRTLKIDLISLTEVTHLSKWLSFLMATMLRLPLQLRLQ